MFTAKVAQNITKAKKKRHSKPNYALDTKYKLPLHNLASKSHNTVVCTVI